MTSTIENTGGHPTVLPPPGLNGRAVAARSDAPPCRHCQEPLTPDPIWGPVHASGGYLCVGPNGETMTSPATLPEGWRPSVRVVTHALEEPH
ncbi:hypothetical protein R8Z50_35230 [Longispora sp. K20-0274]|uniref:hypothetical protein n=1 Tax=Longispora sp. K20-0274 TaxID=3088255 RepID=UPI0039998BC0